MNLRPEYDTRSKYKTRAKNGFEHELLYSPAWDCILGKCKYEDCDQGRGGHGRGGEQRWYVVRGEGFCIVWNVHTTIYLPETQDVLEQVYLDQQLRPVGPVASGLSRHSMLEFPDQENWGHEDCEFLGHDCFYTSGIYPEADRALEMYIAQEKNTGIDGNHSIWITLEALWRAEMAALQQRH